MSALKKGWRNQRATNRVVGRACAEVLEPRLMFSGVERAQQRQEPIYDPIQIESQPVPPIDIDWIILPPPWPEPDPHPHWIVVRIPEKLFDINVPPLLPQPPGWYQYGPAPAGLWPQRSIPLDQLISGSPELAEEQEARGEILLSRAEVQAKRAGIAVLWDE